MENALGVSGGSMEYALGVSRSVGVYTSHL